MTRSYAAERYEEIFDRDATGCIDVPGSRNIKTNKGKAIYAGDTLEVDIYPVWNTRSQASEAKKAKKQQNREMIERRNNRNAERKISQLVNTNFMTGDLSLYLSFEKEPTGWDEAHSAIDWFTREVRKRRKMKELNDLVYLYIYESADKDGNPIRQHFHIFVNGGISREEIEDIWRERYGIANSTRLQVNEYGLTGFAKYVLKAPRDVKNRRRWATSRNIKQPVTTRSTRLPNGQRLTKKLIADLQSGRKDAKNVFEAAYKGYFFVDFKAKQSDYVSGTYLYVRLRKLVA